MSSSNRAQGDSNTFSSISSIPVPQGFTRIAAPPHSFTAWLRQLQLKSGKTVYLYTGQKKPNQSACFAVLDFPAHISELHQCADIAMMLWAEYLYSYRKYDSIRFMDYENGVYTWTGGNNRPLFDRYLKQVFGMCGSASLQKQLAAVHNYLAIKPGDMFIKGGFPGHVMVVADVAVNDAGEKVFLLLQGFLPAQDAHLVINPQEAALSPWYSAKEGADIITSEWRFSPSDLRCW